MFWPGFARDIRGMNKPALIPLVAMMAAIEMPAGDAGVPDWVHLLPATKAGQPVATADTRGPYVMGNAAEIIAASFANADALEVDVNHASFVAAPQGGRSDAMGWVKEMQARDDGVWGRVEWTPEGKKLVGEKAYRRISPVIIHDLKKNILRIANISLVNRPNLPGLAALNQETHMNLQAKIAEKLGLAADATEEAILAVIPATATALQSAMTEIGVALGIEGGDGAAILAAARTRTNAQPAELVAMQTELTSVATELNTLKSSVKRQVAAAFVDGAIKDVRAGVKPQRDRFIAMHMADPKATEDLICGLPTLGFGGAAAPVTNAAGEIVSLNAEQVNAARMLGVSETDYLKTLKAERGQKETV